MDSMMELEIGPGPDQGSYIVDVLRSAARGEARETFTLEPGTLIDLHDHLEASILATAIAQIRRTGSDDEAAIQQVGRQLFERVFTGAVREALRTSLSAAWERGEALQIILRLSAPELTALPWEALFDSATEEYVCRKKPLIRRVAGHSFPPLGFEPPLRVLAVVSSPRGLPRIDSESERDFLVGALSAGTVEVGWLADATWSRLHQKILAEEWHVLHFIGHSRFDPGFDEDMLALTGRDGSADFVSASSLADLLGEADPMPRVVVLHSGHEAPSTIGPVGVAAGLVRSGIQAAVAMQYAISGDAAREFFRGFYSGLARGRPINEAVRTGRGGILTSGWRTLEWIAPVMYVRGEETLLFERRPAAVGDHVGSDAHPEAAEASDRRGAQEGESPRPDIPRYFDFDLLISPSGQAGDYIARVLRAPTGDTGPVQVRNPFSDVEFDDFLQRIGRPRHRGTSGFGSPDADAVRDFGSRLFAAVFHDQIAIAHSTSLDYVESQDAGLRLRLRLADAPELADLPWEYLYDGEAAHFIALSTWTPLVRYLEVHGLQRPAQVGFPLRILVMTSSPDDHEPLDAAGEVAKLEHALRDLTAKGRVQVEVVEGGTYAALQGRLRRAKYHVFHYIGHGGYDPGAGDGFLVLEDEHGRGQRKSASDVGVLLHDHRSLRMVVLNSCEGARGGRTDPFAGTAQSLVRQGLPAVIAMQFEITDQAAVTFSRSFYEAVADGFPLDASMAEARKAIHGQQNPVEWGTPVLYMRAADGQVFDFQAAGPAVG